MNTSSSSNTFTHPGRAFFQKIESPPTTGEELLNLIATGSTSKSAFAAHEKAWMFNYFCQQMMRNDPRFNQDVDRVNWPGQLKTLPSCLRFPRGDLLITEENGNHGFVLTKFRSNPKSHLCYRDVKPLDLIHNNHLNNCGSSGKLYLISTVKVFNMADDQEIEVILRDDLLHPITSYTLAIMFGDNKRADEMNLPSLLKDWKKEREFRNEQALQRQKDKVLKEEAKIRRAESRVEREAERALKRAKKDAMKAKRAAMKVKRDAMKIKKAAMKAKKAANKAKKTKKSSKKGKEKVMGPIPEGEESSSRPQKAKKTKKVKKAKKVKRTKKGKRIPKNKYQHIKGTERVGWKEVILREIYQNHDEEGRIDVNHMTSGKRGKALYQQITTRKCKIWKQTVGSLRGRILSTLRDLKKYGSVDQRDGKWYFNHPITKEVSFQELSWEQKWKHIETFSVLFGHLPEQKDAVNPILAGLWLARQRIHHAINKQIILKDDFTDNDEEESSFDSESFLEGARTFIRKNSRLFKQNNIPVLLPIVS